MNTILRRQNMIIDNRWKSAVALFILMVCFSSLYGVPLMKFQLEINLAGDWRFEIGKNSEFLEADFNDSEWEVIHVPNSWENEGFPGYDGYGCYRIKFRVPSKLKSKKLYLKLGRIDDVDRVYLNGQLIGGVGDLLPNYRTAFNIKRIYPLDPNMIRFNEINTLAVQVFDMHGVGGIYEGEVGLYSRLDEIHLDMDLSGQWKFRTGDQPEWAKKDYRDSDWAKIHVPMPWEWQGYENYDGYAWYRKNIRLSPELLKSKLILMLGYIGDVDEVFFNGIKIGSRGEYPPFSEQEQSDRYGGNRAWERAYFIPSQIISKTGENVIAVRVFNEVKEGGIYEGYVGIVMRTEYLKYSQESE